MSHGEPQNVAGEDDLDTWFTTVYDQLRALARRRFQGERSDDTLQPTALVNEVFLRLQNDGSLDQTDQSRFFLAAAEAMRWILMEHSRASGRKKRGGDDEGKPARRISLDAAVTEHNLDQILTPDDAICRMDQNAPDQAQPTVMRLWQYARLALARAAHG